MEQDGYEARSRAFLNQAKEELAKGDSVQASEKLWGAAAQVVKGAAAKRGWRHDGHGLLFRAVRQLVDETGDAELHPLFTIASGLQMNFYEHWMDAETVRADVPSIERFIDKLAAL
jgi:hypothetical protein